MNDHPTPDAADLNARIADAFPEPATACRVQDFLAAEAKRTTQPTTTNAAAVEALCRILYDLSEWVDGAAEESNREASRAILAAILDGKVPGVRAGPPLVLGYDDSLREKDAQLAAMRARVETVEAARDRLFKLMMGAVASGVLDEVSGGDLRAAADKYLADISAERDRLRAELEQERQRAAVLEGITEDRAKRIDSATARAEQAEAALVDAHALLNEAWPYLASILQGRIEDHLAKHAKEGK